MLPFVAIDETKIAPFHPYGVCCAIAFFAWDHVLMQMAVRRGYDRAAFRKLTIWIGVLGWSFAWLVDALFYHPSPTTPGFGVQRLSATGAILGAMLATVVFSRRRKLSLLPMSEVILSTWPVAFAFGRLGCSLIHDHVGKATAPGTLGSLFAVGFPRSADDGLHRALGPIHLVTGASDVRYDLGLLELMVLAPLAIGFALTWKRKVALGTYTIVSCLVYGPVRFILDFLRAEDGLTSETRFAGLTFAQYWSLAVIGLGIVLLARRCRTPKSGQPSADSHPQVGTAESGSPTADGFD